MKLILWLWNPWSEYTYTRHNIWFLFLNFFASRNWFWSFKLESKFKWEIAVWDIDGEKTILLKPITYMNLSWESLREVMNFYKIEKKDFIVVFDDMSMNFGKLRYRENWSAGWHNGIKSIIKNLWEEFKRIKVWVGFNPNFEVSDWVLSKFSKTELDDLKKNIFFEVEKMLEEKI
jgi:PTH1 family peptidyl-tRNA hydrolase